jgi:hypothetical protein
MRQTVRSGMVQARRPKYLFSGLTKCGACGGGFILSSHGLLVYFTARDRGTCANTRRIKRSEVEARVLRAMKERFFDDDAFADFCNGFAEEMNRLRREHRAKLAAIPRELAAIERRCDEILKLLLEGFRSEAWKAELQRLDEQKAELKAALATSENDPPLPAFHPHMADVFRQKTATLTAALEQRGTRWRSGGAARVSRQDRHPAW